MPYGLYGFGQPQEEEDPVAKMVQQILGSLEPTPVPPPPQLPQMAGRGANIAGGIGDALLAMSAVRAGGQAPQFGPFATRQMRTQDQRTMLQQKYQETVAGAQADDREARNRVRTEGGLVGLRSMVKPPPRPFRPQMKTFKTLDPRTKRPVEIPYLFDPNQSTLQPMPGYESGFQQYVRPFLAQGINQDTGELEFRLLDPFSGQGGASTGGGPIDEGDPRYGGGDADKPTRDNPLSDFGPKPTAGEIEGAESAAVISEQLRMFKDLASKYKGGERTLGTARATGQGVVRAIPLLGKPLSESFGDPAYEELSATRNRIGQQLARLVENGRLSDQDRDFALENLPTIESLTTESGRQTAAAKIALVERELAIRMERKRRLRPGLNAPTPSDDPAKALFREMFGRDPEE